MLTFWLQLNEHKGKGSVALDYSYKIVSHSPYYKTTRLSRTWSTVCSTEDYHEMFSHGEQVFPATQPFFSLGLLYLPICFPSTLLEIKPFSFFPPFLISPSPFQT